jgi:rhodanese-related sulfurtransferase
MKPFPLLLVAVLVAPAVPRAEEVKLIPTAELSAKVKAHAKDLVLVDSRTEVEFGEGHIPGAILIPAKATAAKLPGHAAKEQLVVFYCNGPDCTKSRKAYKAAAALGYANLREYTEGLPAWKLAGLEVVGAPLPPFDVGPGLEPKEVKALLAGPGAPAIIDVRDADEFEAFRLAGARSFPVDAIAKRAAELPAGPILLVDHAGHQIKVAARLLAKLGHRDLKWLRGGLLAWSDAGLPTEEGKK